MKNIITLAIGLFVAGLLAYFLYSKKGDTDFFLENQSQYGFEETVAQLEATVSDTEGWKILHTYNLQESMRKHGHGVQPVKVFSLCNPSYSAKILLESNERIASSMMPCRVSIYVKADGKTYISRMNSGQFSENMGGIVEQVMGKASADVEEIIADLIVN